MDLSNKSLALLLVAAIIISLGGTMISLNKLNEMGVTGLVPGQVTLAITSNMSCNVDSNVSFGSGGQPASSRPRTHRIRLRRNRNCHDRLGSSTNNKHINMRQRIIHRRHRHGKPRIQRNNKPKHTTRNKNRNNRNKLRTSV